jgi:hypothetical protein
MMLAQLTANQIPYDKLDWLQIAIYFLALPIVALFGAAIGLLGRWRRGGILWSTNVGLLGGMFACVVIAIAIATLEGESIANYFYDFLDDFRWKMLAVTLASTGICAFVAAICWRSIHPPREKQPFVFSVRTLLLVQLLVFVSMGSFIGLRLYMIDQSGQSERLRPENFIPGWVLWRGGEEACVLREDLSAAEIRNALAPDKLREVAKIPHLDSVHLYLDGNWDIDLAPLVRKQPLFHLGAECIDPDPALIVELSKVKTRNLWLSGDFAGLDLSPLANSSAIENLTLSQGRFTRDSIESLSKGSQLKGVTIWYSTGKRTLPIRQWPKSLRSLTLASRSDLTNEDLKSLAQHPSLEAFEAWELTVDDNTLIALQSIPTLRSADIKIDLRSLEGYQALAKLNTSQVRIEVKSTEISPEEMAEVVKTNGLASLSLTSTLHNDEAVAEISKKESLKWLYISSPLVTQDAMLRMANLPNLERFGFPEHLKNTSFVKKFETQRRLLRLPKVLLFAQPRPQARTNSQVPKGSSTVP